MLVAVAVAAGPLAAQAPDSAGHLDLAAYAANPRVQHYLEYFTGRARDRFAQWLKRGSSVQSLIGDRLERAGLPNELSFLPLVESGYSNTAVSRAGAVGMWQFIPETARNYGLRVDRWVDERRDPERATDAATRHLSDLQSQFGSPYLAMAAYNAGAGRITRGLTRLALDSSASGPSQDDGFFRLAGERSLLAKETQDYVPQLIAAAIIGKDPEKFGFTPPAPAPATPVKHDSVKIDRPVRLAQVARAVGLSSSELYRLNPQFIRGVVPPDGGVIRLPEGMGSRLEAQLAQIPTANPYLGLRRTEGRRRPRDPSQPVHVRVRAGETLDSIAARLNVSADALRRTNALPKGYPLIRGQILRVPEG